MDPTLPLQIDVEELARWRAAGIPHSLLDVREPWETALCLIEGSLAIPLGQLPARAAELPTGSPLVVVCHHGGRSMQAVAWLRRNLRDDVTNLAGGVDAWARRIDPSMAVY
jgi:rhodanese-related sulfurtransferase